MDIVVEETAGVAGQVTAIDLVLRNGSVVLAGPGQYNADNVTLFAGGTNRVPARGSLTIRNVATHFSDVLRGQLPAIPGRSWSASATTAAIKHPPTYSSRSHLNGDARL